MADSFVVREGESLMPSESYVYSSAGVESGCGNELSASVMNTTLLMGLQPD